RVEHDDVRGAFWYSDAMYAIDAVVADERQTARVHLLDGRHVDPVRIPRARQNAGRSGRMRSCVLKRLGEGGQRDAGSDANELAVELLDSIQPRGAQQDLADGRRAT